MHTPDLIAVRYSDENDRSANQDIIDSLRTMLAIALEFDATLSLFEACRSRMIKPTVENAFQVGPQNSHWSGWSRIPAKYGPFLIYNFRHAMMATRQAVKAFPRVNERADWPMLDFAKAKFRAGFPDWAEIRNAFGHAGELDPNEHALKGPTKTPLQIGQSAAVYIGASVAGAEISTSFGGRMVKYRLEAETADRIWIILAAMHEGLSGEMSDKPHDQRAMIRLQEADRIRRQT